AHPQLALEREGAFDDGLRRGPLVGLGAECRDPDSQPEVGGTPTVEEEAKRQQVVVERLEHGVALETGLEPGDRARQGPRESATIARRSSEWRRALGERPRQGDEVGELFLGEDVSAGPGSALAGRDSPPAVTSGPRPGVGA